MCVFSWRFCKRRNFFKSLFVFFLRICCFLLIFLFNFFLDLIGLISLFLMFIRWVFVFVLLYILFRVIFVLEFIVVIIFVIELILDVWFWFLFWRVIWLWFIGLWLSLRFVVNVLNLMEFFNSFVVFKLFFFGVLFINFKGWFIF